MAKRKRPVTERAPSDTAKVPKKDKSGPGPNSHIPTTDRPACFQIIAGSYDRTLHGIIATISPKSKEDHETQVSDVSFNDNFLFNAHGSAIRCLAVSPGSTSGSPSGTKVTLATGGTDERVNLYQLDASMPAKTSSIVRLGGKTLENPKNKELGSLLHHSSSINALHFASNGKLLSAAGDNTIAITRTRDWTVLSTIKAPVPRVVGRPSGDTAGPGEVPMGINDFAVHPSRKLMISVGKGEKCMRLWNLVTGKKAGVLNFEKDLLIAAGEGRWSRGEGLRVEWNHQGDEFAVAFERGVAVFSMDSEPKGVIQPSPLTKVHQLRYIRDDQDGSNLLAVSTEDGRVIMYSTSPGSSSNPNPDAIPLLRPVGQLGGRNAGSSGRIKDFEVLPHICSNKINGYMVITGSSDGSIRIWEIRKDELQRDGSKNSVDSPTDSKQKSTANGNEFHGEDVVMTPQVGTLLDVYSTSSRVTCLRVFEMKRPDQQVPVNGERTEASSESEEDVVEASEHGAQQPRLEDSDSGASEDGSENGFEGFD